MLETWVGQIGLEAFVGRYLAKYPLAQPGTTSPAVLDWPLLARVLAGSPEGVVVARGKLLDLPMPRSLVELRGYLDRGIGLCLRRTERCVPELARIARAFEADLGPAEVQLFVTPAGTHGFGWHYDDEHVFIAQALGTKDYYFRANTVCPETQAHGSVFSRFSAETSPLGASTLIAGDFLYVPARWWHMAICHADALSISVGVRPR